MALSTRSALAPGSAVEDQLKFPALGLDLRQQALAEIACGDAHRIELADYGETGLEVGFGTVKHGLGQLEPGRMPCCGWPCALRCPVCLPLDPRLDSVSASLSGSERFRHELLAQIALEQLFIAGRQIAILVQVADDVFGRVANRW